MTAEDRQIMLEAGLQLKEAMAELSIRAQLIRELEAQLERVTMERDALMGRPDAVHQGAMAAIETLRQSQRQAAAIQAACEALEKLTMPVAGEGMPYHGNANLPGDAGEFYLAYNTGIDTAFEFTSKRIQAAIAKLREVQGA